MNVANRKCIRRLSVKSLQAAKARNAVAVIAIALTTILFTTLFTILLSVNYALQQANFRQVGGYAHGGFKYLSEEQREQLKTHPLIKEYGQRLVVSMLQKEPFNKAHVEISYSDANEAKWGFAEPVKGHLPQEGTQQAATDTRVLALLGIEPELGVEFTIPFPVDGVETTRTFTLCGWWEYDEVSVASHILIPLSRAEEIFDDLNTTGADGITGTWNLEVMFSNASSIWENIQTILLDNGYQGQREDQDGYIATGVNWGYTGAQMSSNMDAGMAISIVLMLLLMGFTGYLIIYNVFQISVTHDIRFYGLLKTIGTTGRQLKRIIRIQALVLSCVGIPLGLLVGYGVGAALVPAVLAHLNGVMANAVSASPLIFVFSAVFSLGTVLISCQKPGKMAAKVSPVEALRYTGSSAGKKALRKSKSGASLPKMAWANLGRNPVKMVVTILSLSLAVVLLNLTLTFTKGFDMDKYLRDIVVDFIVADAGYFQVSSDRWNHEMALSPDIVEMVQQQGGISQGGKTYGQIMTIQNFISEEEFRQRMNEHNSQETVDWCVEKAENLDGRLGVDAKLFGMEAFVRDKLKVIEGDMTKLQQPGGRYVAAVYMVNDYGIPIMDGDGAQVGDVITLRYIDEFDYFDGETGELLGDLPEDGRGWYSQAKIYRDIEYEVAALVSMPSALSYRCYGWDGFVLNDQTFRQDSDSDSIVYYAFDTAEESVQDMEVFLKELTGNRFAQYDYESKESYVEEFESFQRMFLLMGGVLSFVIGLVGVLNFVNAVLTGILTRRRDFAVLQSVGMTGRQLKIMLVWEGLYYTLGAALLSLALCILAAPVVRPVLEGMFWFFSYHFTVLPALAAVPIFALLGSLLPLAVYGAVAKRSIVERLREAED